MGAKLEGVAALKKHIREQARKQMQDYVKMLNKVGLDTVKAIRTSEVSYWIDQTGNLRSSIGYLIVKDGRIISENFELVNGRGQEGLAKGRSFADELASQYPSGYALIIVAGMEYAAYVENIESRTVLAGGTILAKQLLQQLIDKYNAKYGK
jgi:hypothetical protein